MGWFLAKIWLTVAFGALIAFFIGTIFDLEWAEPVGNGAVGMLVIALAAILLMALWL
jgi:hypothetical protein